MLNLFQHLSSGRKTVFSPNSPITCRVRRQGSKSHRTIYISEAPRRQGRAAGPSMGKKVPRVQDSLAKEPLCAIE